MAHYRALSGRHFMLMLLEDGWKVATERATYVLLKKAGKKVTITTNAIHHVKRVTAVCEANDISTTRFQELMALVVAKTEPTKGATQARVQ